MSAIDSVKHQIHTFKELADRFATLRQAPSGDRRAPHKPLLILWMLGRYEAEMREAVAFTEARERVAPLLREFGPATQGAPDVMNPFWRLQNDPGEVWAVARADGSRVAEGPNPPGIRKLEEAKALGNFTPVIRAALVHRPEWIQQLAMAILGWNFPNSLHEDIAIMVGLSLDWDTDTEVGAGSGSASVRDPKFREKIIRAYEYRCSVTDWSMRLGDTLVGLEAAHIKWHTSGGPAIEGNGLALQCLMHKLFDRGAFTLSVEKKPVVLVSQHVNSEPDLAKLLVPLHGKEIRLPHDRSLAPQENYILWHQDEVFKGPARAR